MFRNVFSGCVSDRSSQAETFRSQKIKFGASLPSALKHDCLPGPLVDILVHIARDGVMTTDVFRRPGNPNDTRRIVKRLTEGKQVIYANYSFYTLASVVKKFLLKIPGGVFTPEGEAQLLRVLTLSQRVEQVDAVHSFIEKLTSAHQQLVALLFGTWFRIVTYKEQNCMSVEALSRSVAGSMFHTCAEDPAKVEQASRVMQFLIDNFVVENMFGQANVRFFMETTHTVVQLQQLYSFMSQAQTSPRRPEVTEVTRMGMDRQDVEEEEDDDEDRGLGREYSESPQLSPSTSRRSRHEDLDQLLINTSTLSAPEVSLVPSPEVSKRPKSLEDNLNEVRSHYQNRCLSRFNSVKRKQLERLQQRSDWFLSPTVRERNNSRKYRGDWGRRMFSSGNLPTSSHFQLSRSQMEDRKLISGQSGQSCSSRGLHIKNTGNSVVVKASSEGAVLEAFSDGDSVFTDNTSRSESPASEPVWSHILKVHSRDIIHSDTGVLAPPEMSLYEASSGADLSIDSRDSFSAHHLSDTSPCLVRSKLLEEEEDGNRGDDEEEDTPTGVQEEENTLLGSSVQDLHQHSSTDKGSTCSQELDKDSPLDSFGEPIDDLQLRRREGGGSFKSQSSISKFPDLDEETEEVLSCGQHRGQISDEGLEQQHVDSEHLEHHHVDSVQRWESGQHVEQAQQSVEPQNSLVHS